MGEPKVGQCMGLPETGAVPDWCHTSLSITNFVLCEPEKKNYPLTVAEDENVPFLVLKNPLKFIVKLDAAATFHNFILLKINTIFSTKALAYFNHITPIFLLLRSNFVFRNMSI